MKKQIKCDFCPYSKLKNGKFVCPYGECLLSPLKIEKMLDKLSNLNE